MLPSRMIQELRINIAQLNEYKKKFLKRFLFYYEISASELKILSLMNQSKPSHIKELAAEANFDTGNTSRLVRSLENKGLVISKSTHFDKRSKLLHLTGQGRDILHKLDQAYLQRLGEFFLNHPKEKQKIFLDTLIELNSYLASEQEAARMNRKLSKKARTSW
ncbi:MAG: MarR family transcriptional regulator [Eubacteriales bacterium]|nr:MarR family transcriptional regulator [Eubacteriales bacterium]